VVTTTIRLGCDGRSTVVRRCLAGKSRRIGVERRQIKVESYNCNQVPTHVITSAKVVTVFSLCLSVCRNSRMCGRVLWKYCKDGTYD